MRSCILTLALLLIGGCTSRPPVVAVISVRGAEQDIIASMLERGELPDDGFFAGLSSWGDAATLVPVANAVTAVNAMTFETGATPGEHGVVGNSFGERSGDGWRLSSGFQSPPRVKPAWQIAAEAGVHVVRMGSIFDLRPTDENVFSLSQPAPADSGFQNRGYPAPFVADVERALGPPPGGPDFAGWFQGRISADTIAAQINREVDYMLGATLRAVEGGDVEMLWMDYALFDRYGHAFTQPSDRGGEAVQLRNDAYRRADRDLGRLTAALPVGSVIVLVSGHGFAPVFRSVGTQVLRANAKLPNDAVIAVSRTSAHVYGIPDAMSEHVRERLLAMTDPVTAERPIDAVLTDDELEDIGMLTPDRSGDLWIRMADGFVLHESSGPDDLYRRPFFPGDHGGPGETGWVAVHGCGRASLPDSMRAEDTAVSALALAGVEGPFEDRSGRNAIPVCR